MDYIRKMELNDGDLIEFEDGEIWVVGGIQEGSEDRHHVRLDRKYHNSKTLIIRKRF